MRRQSGEGVLEFADRDIGLPGRLDEAAQNVRADARSVAAQRDWRTVR